ncbi:2976_t:CDS:2, partial [Rhizophagus irregularis]
ITPLNFCRAIIIAIFGTILLTDLIILSIGVHNDLPTVTDGYSEMTEFPAPLVGFQLKNNFSVMCHFQLFDYYDSSNCSKYLTQPTFNEENGQWTGKFSPINNLAFPKNQTSYRLKRILFKFNVSNDVYIDGDIPAFTINVFDSTNQTLAQDMYEALVNNKYYSDSSPLSASVYRTNRYFLGRNYVNLPCPNDKENHQNDCRIHQGFPPERETLTYITAFVYLTTRNDSWYADAAAGFMLDPNSFLLEEQTEQRNKNALSVISNVLSIFGALFTFYALLFGVSSIKPWGFMHKRVFNSTTKKTLNEKLKPKPTLLFSANPEYDNLDLKEELIGLKEFLKLYVVNISWLEEDNIKTSKKDDRKTSEKDDKKTSKEDDKKTSEEDDRKTSE